MASAAVWCCWLQIKGWYNKASAPGCNWSSSGTVLSASKCKGQSENMSSPLTFERAHFYLDLDLSFLFRFSSPNQNIITVSPFWKSSLFFQSRDPSCPLVTLLSIRSMSFRLLDIVVFFIISVKKCREAMWFPSKCHRMTCVPQGESESHGNVNTRPQFCSVKIIIYDWLTAVPVFE